MKCLWCGKEIKPKELSTIDGQVFHTKCADKWVEQEIRKEKKGD